MTTTTPTPAFTPEAITERMRELREIAAGVIQHYQSDLDRDQESLEQAPDVPRWLWVPYDSGSHIAALVPHGKRWASEIARHCQGAYAKTPTPYLVTPERVTAITWAVAKAMIEDLPDPSYTVTDKDGFTLVTTSEWQEALNVLEYDKDALTLTEASTGRILMTKDTPTTAAT